MIGSNRSTIAVTLVGSLLAAMALWIVIPKVFFAPREIEFVFPTGFRGPFVVLVGPNGNPAEFVNGKLTLTVPSSRIVWVQRDSAFMEMTRRKARFADGIPLPTDEGAAPNDLVLRSAGGATGIDIPMHHAFF